MRSSSAVNESTNLYSCGPLANWKQQRTFIETLRVSLPFEMDVLVGKTGRVLLAGGPPAYYIETSVMPVFHQLTLRVESATLNG